MEAAPLYMIKSCGNECKLASRLDNAQQDHEVWRFMGGKAIDHMFIAARHVRGDTVAESALIEQFSARSETEGQFMEAALECLSCPSNFSINDRNYK